MLVPSSCYPVLSSSPLWLKFFFHQIPPPTCRFGVCGPLSLNEVACMSMCGRIYAGVGASECLDHWGKWHPSPSYYYLHVVPQGEVRPYEPPFLLGWNIEWPNLTQVLCRYSCCEFTTVSAPCVSPSRPPSLFPKSTLQPLEFTIFPFPLLWSSLRLALHSHVFSALKQLWVSVLTTIQCKKQFYDEGLEL